MTLRREIASPVSTTSGERGATHVLFGRQTELALANFPVVGRRLGEVHELLHSYVQVKAAAARANSVTERISGRVAAAIVEAAAEVIEGRHGDQFPTPVVVGGGGTSTNMNVNEVLASIASRIANEQVQPLGHVNASQSSNDTYPTAMAMATMRLMEPALAHLGALARALEVKAEENEGIRRLGRTCLQDAVSLTVSETHRAQAAAVLRAMTTLTAEAEALRSVPLGGTVLGTGVGASTAYQEIVVDQLQELSGIRLERSVDRFDALANLDTYLAVADAAARAATTVARIASDLRLLSSGPQGGFGDVVLTTLQAGSSIMPGKSNPVIPEFVVQLGYRVHGGAATVSRAVAGGELELNVNETVILDTLITMLEDLGVMARTLDERCVALLTWNGARREINLAAALDAKIPAPSDISVQVAEDAGVEIPSDIH